MVHVDFVSNISIAGQLPPTSPAANLRARSVLNEPKSIGGTNRKQDFQSILDPGMNFQPQIQSMGFINNTDELEFNYNKNLVDHKLVL